MLQAAALLTVLWSSWASYSWLTNAVPAEEVIPARLVIFAAMAAMFVASLAVPGAFGHYGVLFGSAYFVVQLLHQLLYARLVVTILCCVHILVAVSVPSLITLAVLTVLLCGSAGYETATSREFQRELRAR
jgi:low temperature requirement protein LtrA